MDIEGTDETEGADGVKDMVHGLLVMLAVALVASEPSASFNPADATTRAAVDIISQFYPLEHKEPGA